MCARAWLPAVSLLTFRVFCLFRHLLVKAAGHVFRQGVIFREYSRQSTATTHYFPWKFSQKVNKNPVIFREYSQQSRQQLTIFRARIRPTYGATYRMSFRLPVLKMNPEAWTLTVTLTLTLTWPNPNPNPRTHPNPNRIFNRNQNKFFERKQRTEYDTKIKVKKELYRLMLLGRGRG